jgi:hypothetical protein
MYKKPLVPPSNVVAAEKKYNPSAKGPMKKPNWALGPLGKIGKRMKRSR